MGRETRVVCNWYRSNSEKDRRKQGLVEDNKVHVKAQGPLQHILITTYKCLDGDVFPTKEMGYTHYIYPNMEFFYEKLWMNGMKNEDPLNLSYDSCTLMCLKQNNEF